MNKESKEEAKDKLIDVLYSQVVDLTMMSKIELGDDVISEIKRLRGIINQNEPVKEELEYILCAAVWYKDLPMKRPEVLDNRGFRPYNIDRGVVVSGWRHGNCIYQMVAITGLKSIPEEAGEEVQGFLTNKNRFVDRKEGWDIAEAAGQINDRQRGGSRTLYSEDLY
jgi:hypothetical protein